MTAYYDSVIDNLEVDWDDYSTIFSGTAVDDTWPLAVPANVTGVVSELKLTGEYTAKVLYENSDEFIDINTLNIENPPTVIALPDTTLIQITGLFDDSLGGLSIDVLLSPAGDLATFSSFSAIPANKYAVVSYNAPESPAIIVSYSFKTTYLLDGGGPFEDTTDIAYVVLVNYETLNQQFLSVL